MTNTIALRTAMETLKARIHYSRAPLHEALRDIWNHDDTMARFFRTWGEAMETKHSSYLAYYEAKEMVHSSLPLSGELWSTLDELARVLGTSPLQDQLNALALAQWRLEKAEQFLKEDVPRRARLWRYLGFLGGAALMILFL